MSADENITMAPVLTDSKITETVQVKNCESDESPYTPDTTENDSESLWVPTIINIGYFCCWAMFIDI